MAVVGPLGLIGTIEQTWSGGSKVLLITDPTFGADVRTLVDNHFATAKTDGEGVLRLTFAANGEPKHLNPRLNVGDEIVTCGCYGSFLPPGIPIGQVTSVNVAFDGSYVSVAVEPTLDRRSLEEVEVILWSPGSLVPPSVRSTLAKRSTTTTTGRATTTTTTSAAGH